MSEAKPKQMILTKKGSIAFDGKKIFKNAILDEDAFNAVPKKYQPFFEPYVDKPKPANTEELEKMLAAKDNEIAKLRKKLEKEGK